MLSQLLGFGFGFGLGLSDSVKIPMWVRPVSLACRPGRDWLFGTRQNGRRGRRD